MSVLPFARRRPRLLFALIMYGVSGCWCLIIVSTVTVLGMEMVDETFFVIPFVQGFADIPAAL